MKQFYRYFLETVIAIKFYPLFIKAFLLIVLANQSVFAVECINDLKRSSHFAVKSLQSLKRDDSGAGCTEPDNNTLFEMFDAKSNDKSIVNPRPNGTFKPLKEHCFREPQRNTCKFYKECINQRLNCDNKLDDLDYAFEYGVEYCNKFMKARKQTKLPKYKKWISDTMLCLQKKFQKSFHKNPEYEGVYIFTQCVPRNISFENTHICTHLRKQAFDDHSMCYTRPNGSMKGGICNLEAGINEQLKAWTNILITIEPVTQLKNPKTRYLFLKQFSEVALTCAMYYDGWIKLDSNSTGEQTNDTGFSREELVKLRNLTRDIHKKYAKKAYEAQTGDSDDDSVSDADRIIKHPMKDVEYPSPKGVYEIKDNKTIIITKDTIISVENLIIGDNVTIILKNGAQLNLKALKSKIGENFKIISDSKDGEDAPKDPPPGFSQAGYGVQGRNGIHGKAGRSGEHSSNVELHLGEVESLGSVSVELKGGNGGNGQSGGPGQMGGGGECRGDADLHPMFGGKGGSAGQGGYPGQGGEFRVSWSSPSGNVSNSDFNDRVNVDTSLGLGGLNGTYGRAGQAGADKPKCCRFILPKWCDRHLDIRGTPAQHGRHRELDRNYDWNTPENGNISTIEHRDPNFRFTPLVLSVSNSNKVAVKKIVSSNSFSNLKRDRNGDYPITILFKTNNSDPLEIYNILRTKDIDPNVLDMNGKSAIQLILEGNFRSKDKLIKALVDDGAHLNYDDLLIKAVSTNDRGLLRYFLSTKEFTTEELIEAHKLAKGKLKEDLLKEISNREEGTVKYFRTLYLNASEKEKKEILHSIGKLKSPAARELLLDIYESEKNSKLRKLAFWKIEERRDVNPSERLVSIQLTSRDSRTLDYVFNNIMSKTEERERFLKENLNHKNSYVRARVAQGMGQIRSKSSVDELLRLLAKGDNRSVTLSIVDALGEIGDKRAIEPLRKLLDKPPHFGFSSRALKALGKLESTDESTDNLLKRLYKSNGEPDIEIVHKIVLKGETEVIKVVKSLSSINESDSAPIGHYLILGMLDSKIAVPGLIDELDKRKKPKFLTPTIKLLGELKDKRAISHLKKFLNHSSEEVRNSARESLEKINGNNKLLLPADWDRFDYYKNILH